MSLELSTENQEHISEIGRPQNLLLFFSVKDFDFVKWKQKAVCSLTYGMTAKRILIDVQFLLCLVWDPSYYLSTRKELLISLCSPNINYFFTVSSFVASIWTAGKERKLRKLKNSLIEPPQIEECPISHREKHNHITLCIKLSRTNVIYNIN